MMSFGVGAYYFAGTNKYIPLNTNNFQCENHSINDMYPLMVIGGSMYPTLRSGQTLYFIPYNSSRLLSEGTVVHVRGNIIGNYTGYIHRLIGFYGDDIWTKGDNVAVSDSVLSVTSLQGTMCVIHDVGVKW